MKRFRLRRLFHCFPFLQYAYQFDWIKWIYKRVFVRSLPNPKYCIEIVNQCNAECIFCTYPILRDRGKALMSMSEPNFRRTLDFIKAHRRPSISLTPATGEVFMNPQWDQCFQDILDLDFVEDVYFYTNGALLNSKNREKFFQLRDLHKVSISFSTGGVDRETYLLMYGKDLFHHVEQNINAFLECLRERRLSIPISLDVKVPRNLHVSPNDCQRVYNRCNYPHAFAKIRNSFDTLGGWIGHEELQIMAPLPEQQRRKPCHYLNDLRFAANGEVWLCGCVISELPEQRELNVGHLQTDSFAAILTAQQRIRDVWQNEGEVPPACRNCTWYVAD